MAEDSKQEKDNVNKNLEWFPVFQYGEKNLPNSPSVVKFSPMGSFMASGGSSETLIIWDMKYRYTEIGATEMEMKWGP
jgi:WD40 repeat protein